MDRVEPGIVDVPDPRAVPVLPDPVEGAELVAVRPEPEDRLEGEGPQGVAVVLIIAVEEREGVDPEVALPLAGAVDLPVEPPGVPLLQKRLVPVGLGRKVRIEIVGVAMGSP